MLFRVALTPADKEEFDGTLRIALRPREDEGVESHPARHRTGTQPPSRPRPA